MLLNISWSDPTIVGGFIGILGSVIGALTTALLTWLSLVGKIKFIIIENNLKFSEGLKHGITQYSYVDETGSLIKEGSKLEFKLLITNSKKDKFCLSNLEFILKNKESKIENTFKLKDYSDDSHRNHTRPYLFAENYVVDNHSNIIIPLYLFDNSDKFYNNYKKSNFYLRFVKYNGKIKTIKININFNDCGYFKP